MELYDTLPNVDSIVWNKPQTLQGADKIGGVVVRMPPFFSLQSWVSSRADGERECGTGTCTTTTTRASDMGSARIERQGSLWRAGYDEDLLP